MKLTVDGNVLYGSLPLLIDGLKPELSKIPRIAHVGLSVRANGYSLTIPLRYPGYHRQQFEHPGRDFGNTGIVIDRAYGDELYVNAEAGVLSQSAGSLSHAAPDGNLNWS